VQVTGVQNIDVEMCIVRYMPPSSMEMRGRYEMTHRTYFFGSEGIFGRTIALGSIRTILDQMTRCVAYPANVALLGFYISWGRKPNQIKKKGQADGWQWKTQRRGFSTFSGHS
jgi:hypothetical protein